MTTQQAQWLTAAVIFLLAASTILWDVMAMTAWGPDATISRVCGLVMDRYPLITWWLLIGVGLFLGHVKIPAW